MYSTLDFQIKPQLKRPAQGEANGSGPSMATRKKRCMEKKAEDGPVLAEARLSAIVTALETIVQEVVNAREDRREIRETLDALLDEIKQQGK